MHFFRSFWFGQSCDNINTFSVIPRTFSYLDFVGHRTLYIGVHVPLGRRTHRRHRHHGHRHRKRSKERDSGVGDGRESPTYGKCFL